MRSMQSDRRSIPPKEARHFCYRVVRELYQRPPRLETLYPRLEDSAFEAATQELLSELTHSHVWEDDLPGLIQAPSEREGREVKIELVEVATALMGKGHEAAHIWNSILKLVESRVVVAEILKIRYKLTPLTNRTMGRKRIKQVVYPSGRVVLRTTLEKFQRFLREQKSQTTGQSTAGSERNPQVPDKSILPELRTRRMSLGEAGYLMMGYKGSKKSVAKRMGLILKDGDTDYMKINRQSYVFNTNDFPPEAQGKLK